MQLGELIAALEQAHPNRVVKHGFGPPASYRGHYDQLAFEPASNLTVKDMLLHAKSAINSTFEGYKGGHFLMTDSTPVWLASWGELGEEIGPTLLSLMLDGAATPQNNTEMCAARINAKAAINLIHAMGMAADNDHAKYVGSPPAYHEGNFACLADEL